MSNKFSEKDLNASPAPQISKANRHETNDLKRWIPFCFYVPTIITGGVAAIINGEYALYLIVPSLVMGWFCWGFFEYFFHRFALHYSGKSGIRPPGNETHLAHHRNPKALERLYVPIYEGLPIALAFFLGATFLTGSWQVAAYLYAGFMLGYLFYELLDYEAHHGKARGRVMRYYKKYHLQHHHADENARYGVTSPLFDYLFGTYHIKPKQKKARRIAKKAGETI